jgi:hypothetical protein
VHDEGRSYRGRGAILKWKKAGRCEVPIYHAATRCSYARK